MIYRIHFLILFLSLCGCSVRAPDHSYWHETTINDLKFIKETLVMHSAPAANSEDDTFQNCLKEGFLEAGKHAAKVKNQSGYMSVLQSYISGFKTDRHLSISFLAEKKLDSILHSQTIAQSLPFGKKPSMKIEFINKGVWITLPTFNPNEEEKKKFFYIFKKLREFRKLSFILFDLRGNGGGSSDWQRPLLRNLYGDWLIKSLGKKHTYNQTWVKKIRVSPENYESIQDGLLPNQRESFKNDLANNRDFYTETWCVFDETRNLFSHNDKVQSFPKLYLLTDGRCFSTCWLFVREMLQMPNVIQIGAETQSQSLYSQSRWIILPSNLSKLYVPMQQRVVPLEHINETFIPTYIYQNKWNDEEGLKKWALKTIKDRA